jgi:hypothetical protein
MKENPMARAQRVAFLKCSLADVPGSLFSLAQQLKANNAGLLGLWGHAAQPGQAEVYLIPKNTTKVEEALRSSGVMYEEGTGFLLKGVDKTGALIGTLDLIAKAGVNIVSTSALAVGGNYAVFIRVAPGEVEKVALALHTK